MRDRQFQKDEKIVLSNSFVRSLSGEEEGEKEPLGLSQGEEEEEEGRGALDSPFR